MRLVSIAFLFFASVNIGFAASPGPVLERVVMVSRHGVRSPTRTVEVLNALTKRGWPKWPVGPGDMTEHGAKNLGFMADYLRETYTQKGLLPTRGCPASGALAVWADALDRRTRESGDILAARLAPGCGVVSHYDRSGKLDPLFDASKTAACHFGIFATGVALANAARKDSDLLRPEDKKALDVIQGVLAPDACKTGVGLCLQPAAGASSARNAVALGIGATIAEGLYLEYAQGFPPNDVGWGKAASAETIAAIMPVHEHGIDLLRRTPALAGKRGAVMVRTILALLQGRTMPPEASSLSPEAKIVMLAGHDSNLLYLAALMGLDWTLPGQPTMTAPDTTLAFEVWRAAPSGRPMVRVVVYAQTLAQLRDATPLDTTHAPDVVAITPKACASANTLCSLETFTASVEASIAQLCGGG